VVDSEGRFVGFISEFDLLAALESGRELEQLRAEEILVQDQKAAHRSTMIADAGRLMKADQNFSAACETGWRGGRIDYPP